jgi:hypothetical protein
VKVGLLVTGSVAVTVLIATLVTLAGALETVVERAPTIVSVDGGDSWRADTASTEAAWGRPAGRASAVSVSTVERSCGTSARTMQRTDGWQMSPE